MALPKRLCPSCSSLLTVVVLLVCSRPSITSGPAQHPPPVAFESCAMMARHISLNKGPTARKVLQQLTVPRIVCKLASSFIQRANQHWPTSASLGIPSRHITLCCSVTQLSCAMV
ncbi:hypothetical protein F5X68DRAFT_206590 [Plectosphaerella plurivora]|uniref:Secreted protein n=1 Tax=Plectosphaerella plurivora TaxID=936078 RepID=A0A9P8VCZ8_9PEZI|nr:hypothetical protein F5X68DRAFT_206590 [Plectosphaerella plurivora]